MQHTSPLYMCKACKYLLRTLLEGMRAVLVNATGTSKDQRNHTHQDPWNRRLRQLQHGEGNAMLLAKAASLGTIARIRVHGRRPLCHGHGLPCSCMHGLRRAWQRKAELPKVLGLTALALKVCVQTSRSQSSNALLSTQPAFQGAMPPRPPVQHRLRCGISRAS